MEESCVDCRRPKTDSNCGVCNGGVCRKCRVFLSEDEFPFVPNRPSELKHTYYCGHCYTQHVEPFKTDYEESIEKAKKVNVIYKNSKSSVRVIRQEKVVARVEDQLGRNEAILNLAFIAARAGYNAIIEVEVASKKIRNEGYQTTSWSARAILAEIRSHELSFCGEKQD